MKKFTMVLVLFALVASAQASVLFQDDFESDTVGENPSNPAVGTWNIIDEGYGGDADAYVTDTTAAVGSQSMAVIPNAYRPYCRAVLSETTTSDVDITLYFYANGVNNNGRIMTRNSADDKYGVFILLGESAGGGGAKISAKNSSGSFAALGTYTGDTWHRLDITTDLAAGTFDVSLDGTFLGTGYNYHTDVTDTAWLQVNGSLENPGGFDDILVTGEIPEPATLALIALGSVALIRKRK